MCRMLVVEDDKNTRDGLVHLLTDMGYDVVATGSGEHALALMAQSAFDLLITDLRLPGLTGVELLGELRDRGRIPRSILITAYDSRATRDAAALVGFQAVLQKPVDIDQLMEEIERAVVARGGAEAA